MIKIDFFLFCFILLRYGLLRNSKKFYLCIATELRIIFTINLKELLINWET